MKKILVFLFVLIGIVCSSLAQPYITNRGKIRMTYGGGTTDMLSGLGSSQFETSKDSFNFNKPIFVNKVAVGGTTATDGPWKWSTNKYTYYTDSVGTGAVGGWYLGTQNPTKTTRKNINARLNATQLYTNYLGSFGTNPRFEITNSAGYTTVIDAPGIVILDPSSNVKVTLNGINGEVVSGDGTNNATLSPTTGLRLNGSSTVWDDLFVPFETGKSGATDIPEFIADSSYYVFTVDSVAPSQCVKHFIIQMPHSWKEGSDIYPHVYYKHETAVGTPNFIIKYKWYNSNESTSFGWKWYRLGASTGNTNNTVQMAYGGALSGTGKTISSILICQLYLQAAPALVKSYQFDIHYEKDAIGSSTQSTK